MKHKNLRIPAVAIALGVSALVAGCAGGSAGSESAGETDTLTYVSYGSESQEIQIQAFQEPFTEQTGIEFRNDSPPDSAKLKAMTTSGDVSWDVVHVTSAAVGQFCGEYLEPIDTEVVDWSVLGEYEQLLKSECGVPAFFTPFVLVYNTDAFGDAPPTTVEDFFDLEKFPGKRVFPPELEPGILELALLADGVAPEELYPLDIDRALAKLETIKADSIYEESYGVLQQDLAAGTPAMAFVPPTRLYYVLDEDAPYEVIWDKALINFDYLGIPKGSKNAAAANEFLAFILEEPQQTRVTELAGPGFGSVNPESQPQYDEIQQRINPFAAEHGATLVYTDPSWWKAHLEEAYEKFTAWQVG